MLSIPAFATTQHLINIQGKAVNKTTGTLILVGNVSVRIYAAPDNGTAAHTETFTNVITNGTFSVQVGNSTTLNLTYNQIYWMEIDVNGEEVVGNRVRASIVKNKVAPPFRKAEFDIMYDEGISKAGSILDIGESLEVIKKSGAWLLYGEEKLGQGKENARIYLKENPKVLAKIEKEISDKALK